MFFSRDGIFPFVGGINSGVRYMTAMQLRGLSLIVLSSIVLLSCGHEPIAPGSDPTGIPFDLEVPEGLLDGDYNIISGTKGEQQESFVGDSIYTVSRWSVYAQFTSKEPVDFDVLVNFTKLQRHHESDTLRLRSASDTSIRSGDQVWKFREPDEIRNDLIRVTLPAISLLDTIGPFEAIQTAKSFIRSDTAFRMDWKPGNSGGAVKIEWRAPNGTVVRDTKDFEGSYTIPAEVMKNLKGKGTVIFTRYKSVTDQYKGKTIVATRISQRTYTVTVQ